MALEMRERTSLQKLDFNLILVIIAIHVVGLINLYSATHGPNTEGISSLFGSQFIFFLAGWFLFAAATFVNYRIFIRLATPLYIINVLLLVLVSFKGKTSLGATRWLDLGFFHYQPSETMKIVLVLILARYFHTQVKPDGRSLRELIVPMILLIIPTAIVIKQPDLGTGMLLVATAGTLFLFVKIKTKVLVTLTLIFAFVLPVAWKFALKDYQKNRIFTFLDPTRDPKGAGYNSIQSKIAIGSGRLFGKGFRKGTQSQLEFLPESHTDFIYSVLSEEHGFVGSTATLCLFLLLFLIGVRVARQANDKFGALLVMGSLSIIFWHMFVNVGMTTGILPIVGVPLPMISYGGSSFLTTMLGLGIISSVSFRRFLF